MMLSHPVLLGFFWSFLIQSLSGQLQISSQETNKVYAYSYHFLHNGTTNSKDILRTVLGVDPDFQNDPPAGQSIVKTFSSPSIRGFFTKGVLPAGPISQSYNGFGSRRNTNSAIENIKKVVEANLQPPANIATGLLPPISPDIEREFPGDFNSVNEIGLNFQKQDDFPKLPPPPPPLPPFQNQGNFPNIPQIQPIIQSNFPKIPDPVINNNGVTNVETFSRNTPDGVKIEGKVETFSYNSPHDVNPNYNHQENASGFRRHENYVNNDNQITGHRTQSYFRQSYRTVTPNLDSNIAPQTNKIDNNIGNGNQWWNALNVLGGNNNNNLDKPNNRNLKQEIVNNINHIKQNLNNQVNRQFGSRLINLNNNRQINAVQNINSGYNNQNHNNNVNNQPHSNIGLNQRIDSSRNPLNSNSIFTNNNANNHVNNLNNQYNNNQAPNIPFNNQRRNNAVAKNQVENVRHNNPNNKFHNDDTTNRVMNIINDVNAQLNNLNNNAGVPNNNFRLTWDDDITPNFNSDWSRRQSVGNGRAFSNAHSGPLSNQAGPKPDEIFKPTADAVLGNRDLPILNIENQGGNYRNFGGGGVEKFFGFDRTVEGPNSFSRNQQRGFERNFHVNSNRGYQHNNQWSTNTVRRLDAQSSKADFSKDFIDVFRDDF